MKLDVFFFFFFLAEERNFREISIRYDESTTIESGSLKFFVIKYAMLARRHDILQVVYLPFVSIAINHVGINTTVMFGIVKPSATKILI